MIRNHWQYKKDEVRDKIIEKIWPRLRVKFLTDPERGVAHYSSFSGIVYVYPNSSARTFWHEVGHRVYDLYIKNNEGINKNFHDSMLKDHENFEKSYIHTDYIGLMGMERPEDQYVISDSYFIINKIKVSDRKKGYTGHSDGYWHSAETELFAEMFSNFMRGCQTRFCANSKKIFKEVIEQIINE